MHFMVTALMTPFRPGASPPPVRIPTLFTSATLRPPPGLLRGASLANRPSTGRVTHGAGESSREGRETARCGGKAGGFNVSLDAANRRTAAEERQREPRAETKERAAWRG